MCCDTTLCGAQSEICRIAFCAPVAELHGVSLTSHSAIRAGGSDAVVSMTPAQHRHPSQKTVNPVRQCARPRALAFGVAQASPLFSDHAPREVHLWQ